MINAARMPLKTGQSLFKGKYQIDAVLSAGAHTSLYCTRGAPLQPARMLRVVQREASENGTAVFSEYRRRFQTEVKLGEIYRHPNILQVYGLDKDADTLVLVMECASGGSLADRLQTLTQQGRKMSIEDGIRIIQETADGLAVIHAENIVHRNLKPSKLLFDEDGHIKLADLGLAQLPNEPITRLQLRQSHMPHPGTPAYMSPEQKTSSNFITPASDVYALGLILFEILTGHVHRNLRPGIRASKLRPDIPAWLDELLARMLDEDARQRPRDAAEVGKLLRDRAAWSLPAPRVIGANANAGFLGAGAPAQSASSEGGSGNPSAPSDASLRGLDQPPPPRRGRTALAILITLLLCGGLGIGSAVFISQAGWTFGPFMEMTDAASTVEFLSRTIEPTRPRLKVTPSPTPAPLTETPVGATGLDSSPIPTATLAPALVLTPAPGVSIELARVPAGDFLMGSSDADPQAEPNEKPQHKVTLAEYYIAKYEITNAQFAVFVQSTGYTPTAWLADKTTGKPNHPATPISWVDASAFCAWVSRTSGRDVRLPTEAQWEKAARGSSTGSTGDRLYPWGNQPPSSALLNYDMQIKDTSPVGNYSPRSDSPYGAADMAGNVWEWTNTLYSDAKGQPYPYPYDPHDGRELLDPNGVAYRVLRGGSYLNDASYVRSAFRGADDASQAHKGYGFRVVLLP